ncbi:MAG: HAMP domain-containing histidine kinase [Burkholderiales bacterium]|nr:HAMP domain-containing histidine kinase [Flavobacterium sp.]
MKLYQQLSQVSFLQNSYAFKFLFITFLGIHIPLIGILFFVLYSKSAIPPGTLLLFALVMTLVATGITLVILKKLIMPIEIASKALNNYQNNRTVTMLPTEFKDEAGLLMKNIHRSIQETEDFITEKQDLMYLLSHDLRTFSGNSQSLSKMILDENPSSAVRELTELIYESTTQQFHFIDSFIKLIKEQDEISKKEIHFKKINLHKVLSDVADQVGQQLTKKNIELISSVKIAEAQIQIDAELLIRVLVNLIDNAIKFSFAESEIRLDVYTDKTKLVLTVTDSGLGFDPSHKDELFKKFTNKSKLGTANEHSTGIGLYLCKKIIERHQGAIVAKSRGINQGAQFSIILQKGK